MATIRSTQKSTSLTLSSDQLGICTALATGGAFGGIGTAPDHVSPNILTTYFTAYFMLTFATCCASFSLAEMFDIKKLAYYNEHNATSNDHKHDPSLLSSEENICLSGTTCNAEEETL